MRPSLPKGHHLTSIPQLLLQAQEAVLLRRIFGTLHPEPLRGLLFSLHAGPCETCDRASLNRSADMKGNCRRTHTMHLSLSK